MSIFSRIVWALLGLKLLIKDDDYMVFIYPRYAGRWIFEICKKLELETKQKNPNISITFDRKYRQIKVTGFKKGSRI